MLSFFKTLSTKRSGWFLLLFSALVLEGIALYFQHGMGLQPCVMCIYERVAILGIAFAGLFGLLYPNSMILRLIALILGLGSAIKGLMISLTHLDFQLYLAPWKQCSAFAEFPETLPLDKWFPYLFQPYGSCSEISWQFLGFSMVQWLVVIFSFYTLLLALLFISQIKRLKPKQRMLFH
ncbi:disulfide bond formation protein DsbB [Pasteurella canis]|uniref:Disulfide bond formation protein B n=1 Tax=Pasteurella canis TaxID=753 RepID=A0ABQ4VGC2_9PAST|nr:disulfide bond formation protein DsbB [Pasteurella canis]GJH41918.1 disulfide bond formation protein B [Pasteurella canis]